MWGLGIGLRKLVVLTLNVHKYLIDAIFFPLYLCLAQRLISDFFNIDHIAICTCNSLKYCLKHPQP
jgi:hypothetical protein